MENHEVGAIYSYKCSDKEAYLLMDIDMSENPIEGKQLYTFMNWKTGEYIQVSEGLVDVLFEKETIGGPIYSSNEYIIEVYGCDDSTSIREELTNKEYVLLSRIAENITNASEYGCMPTMNIRKVD